MKPSRSGRTSAPRAALETNPLRVGTKRKLRSAGPTSLRWQESTADPRPSLVARLTMLPYTPFAPDPSPAQTVNSAAQLAVGGMTPGHAPVSVIATPSPAAIEGSHALTRTPPS